jgi:ABC-type sugar transport system ATPase subunit
MQRVAIARTLANRPKILLMDEPFSNLDEPLKDSLIPQLKSIFKKYQLTVLIATHHQRDIDLLDARVITLDNGLLKEKKSR